MARKDDTYYCDACNKKIKRNDLIFEFTEKHFCEKCFMAYLRVKSIIGKNWQCRTFVDIGHVSNVYDGEDIPY